MGVTPKLAHWLFNLLPHVITQDEEREKERERERNGKTEKEKRNRHETLL